jgi:hypothetical protein
MRSSPPWEHHGPAPSVGRLDHDPVGVEPEVEAQEAEPLHPEERNLPAGRRNLRARRRYVRVGHARRRRPAPPLSEELYLDAPRPGPRSRRPVSRSMGSDAALAERDPEEVVPPHPGFAPNAQKQPPIAGDLPPRPSLGRDALPPRPSALVADRYSVGLDSSKCRVWNRRTRRRGISFRSGARTAVHSGGTLSGSPFGSQQRFIPRSFTLMRFEPPRHLTARSPLQRQPAPTTPLRPSPKATTTGRYRFMTSPSYRSFVSAQVMDTPQPVTRAHPARERPSSGATPVRSPQASAVLVLGRLVRWASKP